jgi:hypothetical protein
MVLIKGKEYDPDSYRGRTLFSHSSNLKDLIASIERYKYYLLHLPSHLLSLPCDSHQCVYKYAKACAPNVRLQAWYRKYFF